MLGPASADDSAGLSWLLDGRDGRIPEEKSESGALVPAGQQSFRSGSPGDKYRIYLRVAGKYRTVEWERLPAQASAPPEKLPDAQYSLYASFNGWQLEDMFRDDSEPNVHYIEVTLTQGVGHFAIVRNEDMEQVIYPDRWGADESATALGPDVLVDEFFWCISGSRGDVFRIEFRRTAEFGLDTKKVSWKKV